jgi:hypothetical protein
LKIRTKEERDAERLKIAATLSQLEEEIPGSRFVQTLLTFMFPERMRELSGLRENGHETDIKRSDPEDRRGISHPDYFPIYFHRTVSDAIVSAAELERFLDKVRGALSYEEQSKIFSDTFGAFGKDSIREYDFLHKIARAIERDTVSIDAAKSIAMAICENAHRLSNHFLVSETNRALGGVVSVAQRLSGSTAINDFVGECITRASSDTFAVLLLRSMTTERAQNKVVKDFSKINPTQLSAAFTARMNSQYTTGAAQLDLQRTHVSAFHEWATQSDGERAKEIAFWSGYIGKSRRRLAEAANLIMPQGWIWSNEGPQFAETVLPATTLRQLYDSVEEDGALDDDHRKALRRLERLLTNDLHPGEILGERETV